jgi:hypothetical protein
MAKPDDEDFDFSKFLEEFGHGATNKQASDRLRKLVKACQETGRKGNLVLRIEVAAGAGPGALAELRASIKTTEPQPNLPGDTYYVTEDGALVTDDPRQQALPLKAIPINPITSIKPKEPS